MSIEEWNNLKPGDVLRWKRNNGTYILRTVWSTPSRSGGAIYLPIRRRSWTGRITTCYAFRDIGHRVELHDSKTEMLMTGGELLNLCERRFDIPKQILRERTQQTGTFKEIPSSKLAGASMLARHFCKL